MSKLHEILHPDSEITRNPVVEEIVEKTDTELGKTLEDKNGERNKEKNLIDFVIEEVKRLNHGIQIETDRGFIFSSVNGERLKLPDGFIFNHKDEITNNTYTGTGECDPKLTIIAMKVYPISHYDPDCF